MQAYHGIVPGSRNAQQARGCFCLVSHIAFRTAKRGDCWLLLQLLESFWPNFSTRRITHRKWPR